MTEFFPLHCETGEDPDTFILWAQGNGAGAAVASGILDEDYAREIVRRWNAHDAMAKALADIAAKATQALTANADSLSMLDDILALAAPHVPMGARHKPKCQMCGGDIAIDGECYDEMCDSHKAAPVKMDYETALAAQKGAAMPFEPLPPHLAAIGKAANDAAPGNDDEPIKRRFKVYVSRVVHDLLSATVEIEAESAEAATDIASNMDIELAYECEQDSGETTCYEATDPDTGEIYKA